MRILFAASECFPLIKTGGLADVVGSLPPVLGAQGCDVRVLLPGYPAVIGALGKTEPVRAIKTLFGGPAVIRSAEAGALSLLVLDAPHLFDRPGGLYSDDDAVDWPDNYLRFAALSRIAAVVGSGGLGDWRPDIVHCHDWQTGLAPVYLSQRGRSAAATVFTIHNIAYQGAFPPAIMPEIDLPPTEFTPARLEFYGLVSFLKAGLVAADKITTVSPSYAREIRTAEFGHGLDGVLNARAGDLAGILNGIDETVWDPQSDPMLTARFSAQQLSRRNTNREALQESFGLKRDRDALLFAVVSRLADQKGLDILLDVLPLIVGRGGQFVLLGSGDPSLERAYRATAARHPGRVGVHIGYDEPLSHLVYGGADAIVIPSRFEPCGLTQLYALRYGTVPIVARTGGLGDTVIDANAAAIQARTPTGLQFAPVTAEALGFALERAFELHADKTVWRMLQRRGMSQDVGWSRSAERYINLYRSLIEADAD